MTPAKYNLLNELLAEHSRLSADLAAVESRVNKATIKAAEPMLPEYAQTKAVIADLESKIRSLAVENPELFPDEKKTHTTPFGAVSFRATSHLEIDDEEKIVWKIKEAAHQEFLHALKEHRPARFIIETLIRTRETPNLEALEKFGDDELRRHFGIQRKHEEKFSVKPLEVKTDKLAKKAGKELKEAPFPIPN
jgi:Bacteriophage Mu Gam like protein